MKTAKIRYKGYEWEHNPETLNVLKEDNINEQDLPSENSIVRHYSSRCRRVSGKGKLVGEDCLKKFNELVKLQSGTESGILSLPNIKPFYAYFRKLELLCEPSPKVITYSFEFIEDSEKNFIVRENLYHTVSDGETLWDISYKYKVDIETLVSLNPEVKRLDELSEGSRIKIC